MRVVLDYTGEIKSGQRPDPRHVHEIRVALSPQLKRLWSIEDALLFLSTRNHVNWDGEDLGFVYEQPEDGWICKHPRMAPMGHFDSIDEATMQLANLYGKLPAPESVSGPLLQSLHGSENIKAMASFATLTPGIEAIASRFQVQEHPFVPLVRRDLALTCYLKIHVLRNDLHDTIVTYQGDIDNKLKIILDALRVPNDNQLAGAVKSSEPVYCLLEDDKLISGLEITMEQWLNPNSESHKDFRLTITAIVHPTKVTDDNRDFMGGWI